MKLKNKKFLLTFVSLATATTVISAPLAINSCANVEDSKEFKAYTAKLDQAVAKLYTLDPINDKDSRTILFKAIEEANKKALTNNSNTKDLEQATKDLDNAIKNADNPSKTPEKPSKPVTPENPGTATSMDEATANELNKTVSVDYPTKSGTTFEKATKGGISLTSSDSSVKINITNVTKDTKAQKFVITYTLTKDSKTSKEFTKYLHSNIFLVESKVTLKATKTALEAQNTFTTENKPDSQAQESGLLLLVDKDGNKFKLYRSTVESSTIQNGEFKIKDASNDSKVKAGGVLSIDSHLSLKDSKVVYTNDSKDTEIPNAFEIKLVDSQGADQTYYYIPSDQVEILTKDQAQQKANEKADSESENKSSESKQPSNPSEPNQPAKPEPGTSETSTDKNLSDEETTEADKMTKVSYPDMADVMFKDAMADNVTIINSTDGVSVTKKSVTKTDDKFIIKYTLTKDSKTSKELTKELASSDFKQETPTEDDTQKATEAAKAVKYTYKDEDKTAADFYIQNTNKDNVVKQTDPSEGYKITDGSVVISDYDLDNNKYVVTFKLTNTTTNEDIDKEFTTEVTGFKAQPNWEDLNKKVKVFYSDASLTNDKTAETEFDSADSNNFSGAIQDGPEGSDVDVKSAIKYKEGSDKSQWKWTVTYQITYDYRDIDSPKTYTKDIPYSSFKKHVNKETEVTFKDTKTFGTDKLQNVLLFSDEQPETGVWMVLTDAQGNKYNLIRSYEQFNSDNDIKGADSSVDKKINELHINSPKYKNGILTADENLAIKGISTVAYKNNDIIRDEDPAEYNPNGDKAMLIGKLVFNNSPSSEAKTYYYIPGDFLTKTQTEVEEK